MDPLIEKFLTRVEGLKQEATHEKRKVDLRNFDDWVTDQGFDDVTSLDTLDIEDYLIIQNSQGYAPVTWEADTSL